MIITRPYSYPQTFYNDRYASTYKQTNQRNTSVNIEPPVEDNALYKPGDFIVAYKIDKYKATYMGYGYISKVSDVNTKYGVKHMYGVQLNLNGNTYNTSIGENQIKVYVDSCDSDYHFKVNNLINIIADNYNNVDDYSVISSIFYGAIFNDTSVKTNVVSDHITSVPIDNKSIIAINSDMSITQDFKETLQKDFVNIGDFSRVTSDVDKTSSQVTGLEQRVVALECNADIEKHHKKKLVKTFLGLMLAGV